MTMAQFVVISFVVHGLFFVTQGLLGNLYTPPKFAVELAPASIDVQIIDEVPKPPPMIQKPEEIITAPVAVIENRLVVELPSPQIVVPKPEIKETLPAVGVAQQGAIAQMKLDYLSNPAPRYPPKARQNGWEGLVVLRVAVNKEGRPFKLEIEHSSDYDILDQSAMKAVHEWTFRPAQIGGVAIESSVRVPVRFKLEDRRR